RDDGGHADPAVGAGDGHAVDVGLLDSGERAQRLRHFAGRDVLALPAEGVPDAIDEVEVALVVLAHEIAGANPEVPRLEHVAEGLLLGGLVARIPLEPPLADGLAYFIRRTSHAPPPCVAHR